MHQFIPSTELSFSTVSFDRKRMLRSLQDSSVTSLCIDLNQVTHCDSAGLALLIEAKRLCKRYRKPFTIEGMSKEIYALVEFCGVQTVLI